MQDTCNKIPVWFPSKAKITQNSFSPSSYPESAWNSPLSHSPHVAMTNKAIHTARCHYNVLTAFTQWMSPTHGQMSLWCTNHSHTMNESYIWPDVPMTYWPQSHNEWILHTARCPNDMLTAVTLWKLTWYLAMPHHLPNHPIQRNTSR